MPPSGNTVPHERMGGNFGDVQEEHFRPEVPEDIGLSAEQYEEFKLFFIGQAIPKQTRSDEQLRAAGHDSWVQYCLDRSLLNWS
jgi:hypothetical protein